MAISIPKNYIKLYSNYNQSLQTLEILKKFSNKSDVITDATAGIGGNAIVFAKFYKHVNCIEINNDTYSILKQNLKNVDNVSTINENYITIYKKMNQNIIFFDPPWEKNYKNKTYSNLFISNIDINLIIDSIESEHILITLKCPLNFLCNVKNWNFKEFFIYKKTHKLYKIIIFKKNYFKIDQDI